MSESLAFLKKKEEVRSKNYLPVYELLFRQRALLVTLCNKRPNLLRLKRLLTDDCFESHMCKQVSNWMDSAISSGQVVSEKDILLKLNSLIIFQMKEKGLASDLMELAELLAAQKNQTKNDG